MKIKGLLLGMFACAALVACTNDDIVENNNIEQPEKVKANPRKVVLKMLSLSLARFREIQRQD